MHIIYKCSSKEIQIRHIKFDFNQEIGCGAGGEAGNVDHPQGKLSGKDLEQLAHSSGGQVPGTKL